MDCCNRAAKSCWLAASEQAARSNDHSVPCAELVRSIESVGAQEPDYAFAPAPGTLAGTGIARICTRLAAPRFFASMLADGTPVFAKDFSQSCDEGPRMLPSI